jgi:organic radical activating enzyme
MLFARLVGCSVGQKVCTACDTDFSRMQPAKGGGQLDVEGLAWKAGTTRHVCLTGGEPLDRDVRPLIDGLIARSYFVHIETSGTRWPDWLDVVQVGHTQRAAGRHVIAHEPGTPDLFGNPSALGWEWMPLWLTVSPKPGYIEQVVQLADEVKVILGGLGDGPGWPTLHDALRWASEGKLVYLQPRNHKHTVDRDALTEALDTVAAHPSLRLSVQLHKLVGTR